MYPTAWEDSNLLKSQLNSTKHRRIVETVILAKSKNLADPTVRAISTDYRARLDKGKDAVATLLVQQGTPDIQNPIVVEIPSVRALLTNDLDRRVRVLSHHLFLSQELKRQWRVTTLLFTKMKNPRAAVKKRAKRYSMKQRQATQRIGRNLFDTPW